MKARYLSAPLYWLDALDRMRRRVGPRRFAAIRLHELMRSGELPYSFTCTTRNGRLVYRVGPPDFWERTISATELALVAEPRLARLYMAASTLGASTDDPLEVCGLFVDEHRIDVECGKQLDGTPAVSKLSRQEENEIAIELVADRLKKKKNSKLTKESSELTKEGYRKLVKNSGRCGSHWTKYRFDEKVWKQARAKAKLDLRARGGRREGT